MEGDFINFVKILWHHTSRQLGFGLRNNSTLYVITAALLFSTTAQAQAGGASDEVSPPALSQPLNPIYPIRLLDRPNPPTAVVELLVTIDESGLPVEIVPVTWTTAGFVDAATATIAPIRFLPARFADGTPVAVQIAVEIEFAPPVRRPAATSTLFGVVYQRGSKRPMAGALIAAGGTTIETVSSVDGSFELAGLAATTYTFKVLAPNHEVLLVDETFGQNERLEVAYYLEPDYASGLRIRVEGERVRREVSRQTVRMAEIVSVPGVGQDPVRVVQVLAGVATPNDLSGSLLIRGSDDRDNFFEIDGLTVPFIYHVGGLSSVFNGFLVDSTDFFPSNFGVQYSNAVGGAIVVRSRAPDTEVWRGSASVGTLWSEGYVEGPVTKTVSVYAAYRRSYFDLILKAAMPDNTGVSFLTAPSFSDYQGKVQWRPSAANTVSLLTFGAQDKLALLLDKEQLVDPEQYRNFGFRNGFNAVRGSWQYRRGTLFENTALIGYVTNPFRIEIGEKDYLGWNFRTTRIRNDSSFRLPWNGRLRFGGWGNILRGTVEAQLPRPPRPGEYDYDFETAERVIAKTPTEIEVYSLYAEYEQEVGPVTFIGGGVVLKHSELPFWLGDPRLTIRWTVQKGTLIKAGAGIYHQFPPDQYLFAEAGGNPASAPPGAERSWHYLFGVEQDLPWNVRLITEGYYKDMDRRLWQTDDPLDPVRFRNTGEGRAWGIEVGLKKPLTDRVFGWVSYSFSVSERKNPEQPEWKPADFDQPHIVNAVLSWQATKHWRFGGRWRYSSGQPANGVEKAVFYADRQYYLPINTAEPDHRLAAYHRLDLRADYTWVFRRWTLSNFFEVMNVYLHDNPLGEVYAYDYSSSETINSFPFLPYFGVRADF